MWGQSDAQYLYGNIRLVWHEINELGTLPVKQTVTKVGEVALVMITLLPNLDRKVRHTFCGFAN